jgi:3-oxoacyl-(acyl-carrier-protein) synthase
MNKLVIVDAVSLDTKQLDFVRHERGPWIKTLKESYSEMADQVLNNLDHSVKSHVNTVMVCSASDDSYARHHAATNERLRPREVLNALGINLTKQLASSFPNIRGIFKVDAACASGITALDLAVNHKDVSNGVIVIFGIEKPTAFTFLNYFRTLGAVVEHSEVPYPPFDQRRAGFVMADGVAVLAVTTEQYAIKNNLKIIASVDSVGSQTILTHLTSPSDFGLLKQFIESVIVESNRNLCDISWWDAHATATPDGDAIEYKIFTEIFKDTDTVISSYKGTVGHCMSASAVIELVNTIQCAQKGYASKTSNLDPEFKIAQDPRIITDDHSLRSKTLIKTSFGFGGRNGATVITVL